MVYLYIYYIYYILFIYIYIYIYIYIKDINPTRIIYLIPVLFKMLREWYYGYIFIHMYSHLNYFKPQSIIIRVIEK